MSTTYEEFINNILETRGRFACGDEYHETHHIIPRCMGGTDDEENLIDLFAREHFEAHRMLAIENPKERGLQFAWWNMCQCSGMSKKREDVTSKEYEEARINYSNISKYSGNPNAKIVNQYDIDGNFIKRWDCVKLAEEVLGVTCIDACCRHEQNSSGGFQWRYIEDDSDISALKKHFKRRSVDQYNKNGEYIKTFNTIRDAEIETGITHQDIGKCCLHKKSSAGGFLWKYSDDDSELKIPKFRHFGGIVQYNKNEEFIKIWPSARQAHKELGILDSKIILVCQGKRKTAGGFIWRYADEVKQKELNEV